MASVTATPAKPGMVIHPITNPSHRAEPMPDSLTILLIVVGVNALLLALFVWLARAPRRVILEVRDLRRDKEPK
jgi:multisubunit Na+/H+ antiporter MnhC subunit